MTRPSRHSNGFSLIELAVVLAVLGLLLGSLLSPLRAQWQAERLRETRARLDQAEAALLGFALQHGRLPCPADPALSGAAAGHEDCAREQGTLPWVTLGVRETDGWGRRWLYAVSPGFADEDAATPAPVAHCVPPSPLPAGTSFNWCHTGQLRIDIGSNPASSNAVAVIVSFGADGLGAWLPDGSTMPAASGGQAENSDGDRHFVLAANGESDDELRWLSSYRLHEWMLRAGRAP